jgi:hypothetical protein
MKKKAEDQFNNLNAVFNNSASTLPTHMKRSMSTEEAKEQVSSGVPQDFFDDTSSDGEGKKSKLNSTAPIDFNPTSPDAKISIERQISFTLEEQ